MYPSQPLAIEEPPIKSRSRSRTDNRSSGVQDLRKISTRKQAVVAGREGWTAAVVPDEMSKGFLELAKEMSRWL